MAWPFIQVSDCILIVFFNTICFLHLLSSFSDGIILCRLSECAALFHEDPLEGIVRIGRFLLLKRYPKFQEDGFETLSAERPVIYCSVASPLNIVQHLCRQVRVCHHSVQVCHFTHG